VILYHVTRQCVIDDVGRDGVLASMSRGPIKRVWLCKWSKLPWACMHVMARHGVRLDQVRIVACHVTKAQCMRHAVKGVRYTFADIAPDQFISIKGSGKYQHVGD
jgi:hypothetical protein